MFAASAFAHPHHFSIDGKYVGGGGWKSSDGTRGKFSFQRVVKVTKGGMTVKETAIIYLPGGKTMKVDEDWTATNFKNGFFDIEADGKKIGSGYCGVKQCHINTEKDGNKSEETATFHEGKTYLIGSHVMTKEGVTIAWQGALSKKHRRGHHHHCDKCPKGCKDHDHKDHDHKGHGHDHDHKGETESD